MAENKKQKQEKQRQQEQIEDEFELLDNENGKEKEKTMVEQLEDLGIEQGMEPNLAKMKERVEEIVRILVQYQDLKEEDRSRQSYLDELVKYLCAYYGYNKDLVDMFVLMFHPNELVQFLDSNEHQRPTTLRVNSLKAKRKDLAQRLIERGVNLDPVGEWSKVGLKVYETKVPLGATPEYLAGHYMLQSASSFIPVLALGVTSGEKVLDMAAAPGGKTTYIAQLMKNQGILVANDLKKERLTSLKFNLQRMGVQNSIVCNYDGRKLPKIMKGFDRVLLDAPCTGLGIISRDASIKASRNYKEIRKNSHLQKELILAAIDCCQEGGTVVYSTCSVMVQENEEVVQYALKNRFVKVVDLGIELGEPGLVKYATQRYEDNLKKTRRIYPHLLNMDGFYVARLKKVKAGVKKQIQQNTQDIKDNTHNKKEIKINAKKQKKKKQVEQQGKEMSKEQQAIYDKVKQIQLQEQQDQAANKKLDHSQENNQNNNNNDKKKNKKQKKKVEEKQEKNIEEKIEKKVVKKKKEKTVEKVEEVLINKEEPKNKKIKKSSDKKENNVKTKNINEQLPTEDKKIKKVKKNKK